jgi:hypothetical protein
MTLNTRQIDYILKQAKIPCYSGVFPRDMVPDGGTGLRVVNLDPHDRPGTHWVVIYIDANRCRGEYFDSFGREPPESLRNYMNRNCRNWIHNRKQLQSIASKCCGHYCVMYCFYRGQKGVDLNKFVSHFTRDTGFNDAIVRKAFRMICKSVLLKRAGTVYSRLRLE